MFRSDGKYTCQMLRVANRETKFRQHSFLISASGQILNNKVLLSCLYKYVYSRRFLNGHSRKRTALLTTTLRNPPLRSHTNSIFSLSHFRTQTLSRGTIYLFHKLLFCFQAHMSRHRKENSTYTTVFVMIVIA